MFNFVPLTYRAGTNIILNDGAGMFHMEIPAKAMKSTLDTLVIVIMSCCKNFREQGKRRWHKQLVLVSNQTVHDAPLVAQLAVLYRACIWRIASSFAAAARNSARRSKEGADTA